MSSLFAPLSLLRGPALRNRFVLAPLTNLQSHADGTLSEDEFNWIHMRAKSGYGLSMTCAASASADATSGSRISCRGSSAARSPPSCC